MTIMIRDTTIVTSNSQRELLYNSAIVIDGGKITDIGPTEEMDLRYSPSELIQGQGKVIFPGLINCHTHLLATADRGILEDYGFPTTLRFPTTGRGLLDSDERNVFALLACIEAIRSGTTTLLEISNDIFEYAGSLNSSGLRLLLAEKLADVDDYKASQGVFEFSEAKRDASLR